MTDSQHCVVLCCQPAHACCKASYSKPPAVDALKFKRICFCRTLGTPDEEVWPKTHIYLLSLRLSIPLSLALSLPRSLSSFSSAQKMLIYEPAQRSSAFSCLRHPFFSDVQLPVLCHR